MRSIGEIYLERGFKPGGWEVKFYHSPSLEWCINIIRHVGHIRELFITVISNEVLEQHEDPVRMIEGIIFDFLNRLQFCELLGHEWGGIYSRGEGKYAKKCNECDIWVEY